MPLLWGSLFERSYERFFGDWSSQPTQIMPSKRRVFADYVWHGLQYIGTNRWENRYGALDPWTTHVPELQGIFSAEWWDRLQRTSGWLGYHYFRASSCHDHFRLPVQITMSHKILTDDVSLTKSCCFTRRLPRRYLLLFPSSHSSQT